MTYGDIQTATPEAERRYYVYMWFEEINGETVPVYIGMGSGNRWRTRSGRSKIVTEYLKSHNCKPKILVNGLALTLACKLEEMVKDGMVERGVKLLDAEHNLKERKRRQREGLDAMPLVNGRRISSKTGNPIGRPKRELDFEKYFQKQKDGLITVTEACKELGISRTQWYRLAKAVA